MFILEQENTRAKFIAALIFLFPIAGVGLRHWFSGFATLLVLMGLYIVVSSIIKKSSPLEKFSMDEKILISLVASLFVAFLFSGFVNGWNDNQFDSFLGEMNFLFFIPLYIAIKNIKNSSEIILKGTVISGLIFIFPYVYEMYIQELPVATDPRVVNGVYGHLFTGPVAVIVMLIGLSMYNVLSKTTFWKIITLVSIVFAFGLTIATKSGTAYFLLLLMCVFFPFIITKDLRRRFLIYLTLFLILIASYGISNKVRMGVLRVTDSIALFYSLENPATYKNEDNDGLGTAGERIAMWGASWRIFKDNVFFGVGRGNYNKAAQEYYKRGETPEATIRHWHPHSIYFEILVSKGIIGISIFFLLIFVILRMYFLAWKNKLLYNEAALIHILAILLVGLGSEGPVLKNNFISIFLVYTAVFYSSFSQQLKNRTMANSSA